MRFLCLGASYTGKTLAREFRDHEFIFVSREPAALRSIGLTAFHPTDPGPFDCVLDTLPALSDDHGVRPASHPYLELLAGLLSGSGPAPRFIHISSTSVYPGARAQGSIPVPSAVDETTPPAPDEERGLARLKLEEQLRARWPSLLVIRAAGIYGPGRCLALNVHAGDFARASTGNRVVSRIHVIDLCRLIIALAAAPTPPPLVNAVDRAPASNAEVFAWLEKRLGTRVPGDWRERPPTGRAVRSLYIESLLGGAYRFATYREGFEDALRDL